MDWQLQLNTQASNHRIAAAGVVVDVYGAGAEE